MWNIQYLCAEAESIYDYIQRFLCDNFVWVNWATNQLSDRRIGRQIKYRATMGDILWSTARTKRVESVCLVLINFRYDFIRWLSGGRKGPPRGRQSGGGDKNRGDNNKNGGKTAKKWVIKRVPGISRLLGSGGSMLGPGGTYSPPNLVQPPILIGCIVISLSRCCLPLNDEGPGPKIFFPRTATAYAYRGDKIAVHRGHRQPMHATPLILL